MEFLKKNLVKMVGVLLFAGMGVFALITGIRAFATVGSLNALDDAGRAMFTANPATSTFDVAISQANAGAFIYLAVFLSCLFVIACLVMSMLMAKKMIPGVVLSAGSVVVLTLFITGIALGGDFLSHLSENVDAARTAYEAASAIPGIGQVARVGLRAAQAAHITQIAQTVIYMVAFAVIPLALGIKKIVCRKGK